MARDYAAEYRRRVERGLERGRTRQEARGHGRTPEHGVRDALRDPERYSGYLERWFRERGVSFKVGEPEVGTGERTRSFQDLNAAGEWSAPIPPPYKRLYWSRGLWTVVVTPGQARRRRAA